MNTDMNRPDPGFDHRIADWLEADPDRAPSEALDTILAALPSVPQRRAMRVPWRLPTMFPNRVAFAAIAIILVVAGGGLAWSRLGGTSGVGTTPQVTPSPSPSTPPSPTPSASPTRLPKISIPLTGASVHAGMYQVDDFAVPFTVTLQAGTVVNDFDRNNLVFRNDSNFFTLVVMDRVYPDPCHTTTATRSIGRGVDALLAALGSMAGFYVHGAQDALVGGVPGKTFILANTVDIKNDHCSNPDVLWIGTYETDAGPKKVLETPQSSETLWAVDVGGTTVLIGGPSTLVDSLSFGTASPS
jgi:hypothetical protein